MLKIAKYKFNEPFESSTGDALKAKNCPQAAYELEVSEHVI